MRRSNRRGSWWADARPGLADTKQLGIDQGPIVLMIENWRSDFVWNVMKKNPYVRKGLERAGFSGGWLSSETPAK